MYCIIIKFNRDFHHEKYNMDWASAVDNTMR